MIKDMEQEDSFLSIFEVLDLAFGISNTPDKHNLSRFTQTNLSSIHACLRSEDKDQDAIFASEYFELLMSTLSWIETAILKSHTVSIKKRVKGEKHGITLSKREFLLQKHSIYQSINECDLLISSNIEAVLWQFHKTGFHNPAVFTNDALITAEKIFEQMLLLHPKEYRNWNVQEVTDFIEKHFPENKPHTYFLGKLLSTKFKFKDA